MATKASRAALAAASKIDASGNIEADTLDGVDSLQFTRSDQADEITNNLTISNGTADASLILKGRDADGHSAIRFYDNTGSTLQGTLLHYDGGFYINPNAGGTANSVAQFLDNNNVAFPLGDVTVGGSLIAGDAAIGTDSDGSITVFRAEIGYVGHNDYAGFRHIDNTASGNYALLQSSTGETYINTASSGIIHFRSNNEDKMEMDGAGNLVISGGNMTVNSGGYYYGDGRNLSNVAKITSGALAVPQVADPATTVTSPSFGMMVWNTTLNLLQQYTSDGWVGIEPPPTVDSVSPTSYNGDTGTQITVTGSGFKDASIVSFITNGGSEFNAGTTTYNSPTELVATTPRDFTVADEPLSVKVTNPSGLTATLSAAIDTGTAPTFSTGSSLPTGYSGGTPTTIVATDPDSNETLTYSITSGTAPVSYSTSNNQFVASGTLPIPPNYSSTNYSWTVQVTDAGSNTASRAFTQQVQVPIYGTQSAGSLTTSSNQNYYTYVTSATTSAGSTSIVVSNSSGISVGDEILIHQTQDYTSEANSGRWETRYVTGISGGTLTLNVGLTNTYYSGSFNTPNARVTQVVSFKNYSSLTINGGIGTPQWNGYTGGIVILKAKNITFTSSGYIGARDVGFRQGAIAGGYAYGYSGESWSGTGDLSQNRNDGGSGGGNLGGSGLRYASGGGGGAYGNNGQAGTVDTNDPNAGGGCPGQAYVAGQGGTSYGTSDLSRIHLGSGSGAGGGSCSDGHTPQRGSDGGGMIILLADTVTINSGGYLDVRGQDGQQDIERAAGGGGAGGAILIKASTSFTNNGTLQAHGGLNGTPRPSSRGPDGESGVGSGGRIAVYSPSITMGTYYLNGGRDNASFAGTLYTSNTL